MYKLIYIDIRGRGELVRFILSQAGEQFEDERVPVQEWPSYRAGTPLGIVPVLEYGENRRTLSGNGAIARYLAEKHGLDGTSSEENAQLFAIVECVEDLWVRIAAFFWEQDEQRKAGFKREFVGSYLPLTLQKLEAVAAANNCPQGWIHGKKVTYADLAVCVLLEAVVGESPSLLDQLPSLARLKDSVEGLPNIAAWIQQRPNTPF